MLPTTLNTNEVKDSAGSEIEFQRLSTEARNLVFAKIGESPAAPHRLTISHQEIGSGLRKRRRSRVGVELTHISSVDSVTPVVTKAYIVMDIPVGAVTSNTVPTSVLANLISFCASKGASTTILYDGTGYGSESLLAGTL